MAVTTIHVSTAAELQSALASATGGETILLAAGDYGTLQLIGGKTKFNVNHSAEAPVTIRSADAGNPAVLTGLDLRSTSGFTFENLKFDYTYAPEHNLWINPFAVVKSSDLTIRGCTFDGDLPVDRGIYDDGLGFGKGFTANSSSNVVFEDNTIFNFHRGAAFGNCDDIVVRGNDIHSMRLDGLNFSANQGVLIENNHLHDFHRSTDGEHSDMIQFWTTGTTRPGTDIVIRNNRLDIGDGDQTQSIFMRNEEVDHGRAGAEMFYRNVLIEGNTIYNDHSAGISVGQTVGLVIRGNSVLHANGGQEGPTGSVSLPRITVSSASSDVTVVNNLAAIVPSASAPTWTVENNLIVQDLDPNLPGCYRNHFITSTLDARDGVHRFVAKADGAIEMLGLGSAETRYATALNGTEAFFSVTECAVIGARRIFDATFMADILGDADLTADYQWDFGCGHYASGKMVAHDYAAFGGGIYDVKLTIVLANGTKLTGDALIPVHGELIVDFDPETGTFRKHSFGDHEVIGAPAVMDGDAIQLGAPGAAAILPFAHLLDITGSDDFDFHFSIKADEVGASGELFRQNLRYVATIDAAGELGFQVFMTDGTSVRLATSGLDLNDGQWHDIDIQVRETSIQLIADGVTHVDHTLLAPMRVNEPATFVIGNPWSGKNFAGDMSYFEIRAHVDDFPDTPDHSEIIIIVPDNVAGTGMHDPGWTGRVFDLGSGTVRLFDDAHVLTGSEGPVLYLDGAKDYASLGRQIDLETSNRIGFSVDFQRDTVDGIDDRLIWNHMRLGLTLNRDGLMVEVATTDQGFKKYTAKDLGLNDADLHRVQVLLDTETDRLQVLLDGEIVIDATDANFDLAVPGLKQHGWTIGTTWNRFFDGEVHDFRLGDQFHFVPEPVVHDDHSLI